MNSAHRSRADEDGAEMDAEIARKVFGDIAGSEFECPRCGQSWFGTSKLEPVQMLYCKFPESPGCGWKGPASEGFRFPDYSTDIGAAWLVVEALLGRRIGSLVVVTVDVTVAQYDAAEPLSYTCVIGVATPLDAPIDEATAFDGIDATAESAPLAICRAALKALSAPALPPAHGRGGAGEDEP